MVCVGLLVHYFHFQVEVDGRFHEMDIPTRPIEAGVELSDGMRYSAHGDSYNRRCIKGLSLFLEVGDVNLSDNNMQMKASDETHSVSEEERDAAATNGPFLDAGLGSTLASSTDWLSSLLQRTTGNMQMFDCLRSTTSASPPVDWCTRQSADAFSWTQG